MDPADLHHHISKRYNEELDRVRTHFLAMGGLVEQQVQRALRALIEGDGALAKTVEAEELRVNDLEIAIDEECSFLLAMRAPTAGDLRAVVAMMKAVTDLERIGDEGEKIGVIAARLAAAERAGDRFREVRHLGRAASDMLHAALDAFARMDATSAITVARSDHLLDEEFESIQRQCITFMMEDTRAIRRTLDMLWVVRSLERIGDHAKNICEHVVYMARGEDIRHGHGELLMDLEAAEAAAREAASIATPAPGEPPAPAQ
jgi:phosphate transport system protein